MANSLDQTWLDSIFPPERADEFFDALYGGAEEGAYDIVLVAKHVSDDRADLAFELRQRPGKCLKCSLTYGLPQVFERHPLLAVGKAAGQIAEKLGFGKDDRWELGATGERGPELHEIPFVVEKA